MEIIRTITGVIDSVPAATGVTSGTFTGTGRRLAYGGADDLRLTFNKYVNLWLFFPVNNLLVKVASYGASVVWLPLGTNIALGTPEVGHLVAAVLETYQLINVGNGAAFVDRQNLNSGFPLNEGPNSNFLHVPQALDPVVIDATNSSVRVVEQK